MYTEARYKHVCVQSSVFGDVINTPHINQLARITLMSLRVPCQALPGGIPRLASSSDTLQAMETRTSDIARLLHVSSFKYLLSQMEYRTILSYCSMIFT